MKAAVLGAGAWGSAIAALFARKGHRAFLYSRHDDIVELNTTRINRYAFEDLKLPDGVKGTSSLKEALDGAEIIVFSVPSKAYSQVADDVDALLTKKVHVVSTAKGFDPRTHVRLSEVLRQHLSEDHRYPIVSLIGPSYAEEVIQGLLTAVNAVSLDIEEAQYVQVLLSSNTFRVYASEDEIGSECAAALKNVLAIASGILNGLNQGSNARAALVTRGIAEVKRFSLASGGKSETFLGLTGIGDLMLTCNSLQSRNFYIGNEIGKADDAKAVLATNTKTTEGVLTAKYAYEISQEKHIDMPILEAVYRILYENIRPSDMIPIVMSRTLKDE